MKKIGLVSDAGADLAPEIIEKHHMPIAPGALDWPDIENLPGENTFQKMRELEKKGIKSFGKTSQPSPKSFLDAFKLQLERFDEVVCITITSKLSGTYNSAIQGRKFLPKEQQEKIFIVDSLSASGGEALPVLYAIDLIEKGKGAAEIAQELEKLIPQISVLVMFKDPKWLEASGRISSLAANLLRRLAKAGIRPLLTFKEGLLVPGGIRRKAKDIPSALFEQVKSKIKKPAQQGKKFRIVITHGDDWKGAERLKKMIEEEIPNTRISFINIINDFVGALMGPDTLICAWHEKL